MRSVKPRSALIRRFAKETLTRIHIIDDVHQKHEGQEANSDSPARGLFESLRSHAAPGECAVSLRRLEALSKLFQLRTRSVRACRLARAEQRGRGTSVDFRKQHRPRSAAMLHFSIRERSFAAGRVRPY